VLGTTQDRRRGHRLIRAHHFAVADDLTKTTFVIGEQQRRDGVAPPMASTAICIDRDLQDLTRVPNTSGRSFRCNVPDGQTTSGSACSASS
jgi:hypothetical protein